MALPRELQQLWEWWLSEAIPEALTELRRTPSFQSWQEPIWLVHCNNFMVYLGEWKPQDFIANALYTPTVLTTRIAIPPN